MMSRIWAVIGVVAGAGLLANAPSSWGQDSAAAGKTAAVATPRTPDGHPSLSGYWSVASSGGLFGAGGALSGTKPILSKTGEDISTVVPYRHGKFSNLENDFYVYIQAGDNVPLYKPQYWAQILDNQKHASAQDPYIRCMPSPPPRLGAPTRIMESDKEFVFFYAGDMANEFRDIPVGPAAIPPDPDGTWEGDPSSHWDGDTLVIETVGYNDQSWLSRAGYIHGFQLKTIERLHRHGDEMDYQVTVEDPEYLQEPWVLPPVKLKRQPRGWLVRVPPCMWNDVPATLGSTLG